MSRASVKKPEKRKQSSRRLQDILNNFHTPPSLILKRSASWPSMDPKVEARNHEILNELFPDEIEKELSPPPRAQSAPPSFIPPKPKPKQLASNASNLKPLRFRIAGLVMLIAILYFYFSDKCRNPPNYELLLATMDPFCDSWKDLDANFFMRTPNAIYVKQTNTSISFLPFRITK